MKGKKMSTYLFPNPDNNKEQAIQEKIRELAQMERELGQILAGWNHFSMTKKIELWDRKQELEIQIPKKQKHVNQLLTLL